MRRLYGPCAQCIQANLKQHPMPSSLTPPAPSVGYQLSMDVNKLAAPSPGGYTHFIDSIDESSGYYDLEPSLTKGADDLFLAVMAVVSSYAADGHRVARIHIDPESALTSLKVRLGLVGIVLTTSAPGSMPSVLKGTSKLSSTAPLQP